jgi:hypothetical protein
MLFGGIRVPEKVEWLESIFGPGNVQWVESVRGGKISGISVLKHGKVGALLLLIDIMGHDGSIDLINAAKKGGVPYRLAAKGGKGSVLQALEQIEMTLAMHRG